METTNQKTLVLIHTGSMLTSLFGALCAKEMPGVTIYHMVDESLIQDTIRAGRLRKVTMRRLFGMIESAATAGASAIMVTCSSIGPAVTLAQEFFDLPVLRVDEAMAEAAVRGGRAIGVLATLRTTLEPTAALLREKAKDLNRPIEIVDRLCDGAFDALLSGDKVTHDRMVSDALLQLLKEVDTVVLAQASMARVVEAMPKESLKASILSSPELAVRRAKAILDASAGTVD